MDGAGACVPPQVIGKLGECNLPRLDLRQGAGPVGAAEAPRNLARRALHEPADPAPDEKVGALLPVLKHGDLVVAPLLVDAHALAAAAAAVDLATGPVALRSPHRVIIDLHLVVDDKVRLHCRINSEPPLLDVDDAARALILDTARLLLPGLVLLPLFHEADRHSPQLVPALPRAVLRIDDAGRPRLDARDQALGVHPGQMVRLNEPQGDQERVIHTPRDVLDALAAAQPHRDLAAVHDALDDGDARCLGVVLAQKIVDLELSVF